MIMVRTSIKINIQYPISKCLDELFLIKMRQLQDIIVIEIFLTLSINGLSLYISPYIKAIDKLSH